MNRHDEISIARAKVRAKREEVSWPFGIILSFEADVERVEARLAAIEDMESEVGAAEIPPRPLGPGGSWLPHQYMVAKDSARVRQAKMETLRGRGWWVPREGMVWR